MTELDDLELRIAAFLDGTMEPDEQSVFEAEMETDAALAARVARMMGNDDLLRAAFSGPVEQGVDDALLARMGLGGGSSAEVVDLASRRARPPLRAANDDAGGWRRWRVPLGGALAAALGFALVLNVQRQEQGSFSHTMDSLPSGQFAALEDGRKLAPLLSFKASDGRYCREFTLGGAGGIACRGGTGRWKIEALEKGGARLADPGEVELAAGADGRGLDATYERLGASDPLDKASEAALIDSQWRQ